LRTEAARDRALARAIGLRRGVATVQDATAGLGRDAFVLACCGCRVLALECSPILAALLADGLQRASAHPETAALLGGRLAIECADARAWLRAAPAAELPDAVYLDPMLPPQRGRARVKKEMQLLQELIGLPDPSEVEELLALARARARRRVVVKRPLGAPPLAAPDAVVAARRVRWDLYF
jgi:16S rRNA (guanine1516-N2)-methyltransferase